MLPNRSLNYISGLSGYPSQIRIISGYKNYPDIRIYRVPITSGDSKFCGDMFFLGGDTLCYAVLRLDIINCVADAELHSLSTSDGRRYFFISRYPEVCIGYSPDISIRFLKKTSVQMWVLWGPKNRSFNSISESF
jgi:hypothetical protein